MKLFSLLISVCQDHVPILPFTVEVLSKLYQSYSFSILFNWSVVPFLLKFFSPYQVLHPFSTGVLHKVVLPCSSLLMECFQLHSSPFNRNATRIGSFLFLFLYGVLSTLFISVAFFLSFVQPFKVRGFTRLSMKQLSFTSPLLSSFDPLVPF